MMSKFGYLLRDQFSYICHFDLGLTWIRLQSFNSKINYKPKVVATAGKDKQNIVKIFVQDAKT